MNCGELLAICTAHTTGICGVVDSYWVRWRVRECGLTVPVRQKVLAWQNEEVYIPRWSSGTCGCTSSRRSCAAVSLCPCYVFNIVYIEAGIQPNPCPLFGCALYLCW
jgi:hypothetical protein